MSFHKVFAGSIEQKKPDFEDMIEEIRPREFITTQGEIVATIKCYLGDDDVVREYFVRGVTGEIKQWEPSLEDRKAINAQIIAEMLVNNGFGDMHRFKQLIELALERANELENVPLMLEIDKIHYELGGLE